MIQDIYPHKFDISYKNYKADDESLVFVFDGDKVYLDESNGECKIPLYKTLKKVDKSIDEKITYLFKIDEQKFYLIYDDISLYKDCLKAENFTVFRGMNDECARFTGVTALHLYKWYSSNKYCGKCGQPMQKDDVERAMVCHNCNIKAYPTIAPVIMVGIINEDKLLLTKYANGNYKKYTLVAGFVEIGETFEEAVKREVMEEVGLKVKNIKYYKSQPWGFSNALMTGFFAELDGTDEVRLEEAELSEAKWLRKSEIPLEESLISLSEDMIREFINGNKK